jgi:hypothetical protein
MNSGIWSRRMSAIGIERTSANARLKAYPYPFSV